MLARNLTSFSGCLVFSIRVGVMVAGALYTFALHARDDSRPRKRRIAVFQRAGNQEAHYEIGDITGGSCIPDGIMGARFA